jgi:hypothetical protein
MAGVVCCRSDRMTDLMSERIKRWVENALGELTPTNPMHVHLDELVPDLGVAPLVVLPKLREPFLELIAALGSRVEHVMASLTLPLASVETAICRQPDVATLDFDFTGESPSLYLVDRRVGMRLWTGERYRVALKDYSPFDPAIADVVFFYEVYRDARGMADDWELARSIHGQHYPASMRV